ncbi:hypothetical protein [Streptomyces coffeae]|uniref:Uncharacterized protein n=1 Tax=Streptomyces coffeae TaxID=621382 RepID=A0ABS1NBP9_9ACTN|nr:hypothetical protein [Streptomyces coffeae]MBL1097478.1 hypothetical protein [Streptomyces coffeae]
MSARQAMPAIYAMSGITATPPAAAVFPASAEPSARAEGSAPSVPPMPTHPPTVSRGLRRTPWQRPWPWTARAACAALACHVAAVVVNCAAEGVVDIGQGSGFTLGALLVALDATVLLTVLARTHRQSAAEGEAER